jgi:hypothetical protein
MSIIIAVKRERIRIFLPACSSEDFSEAHIGKWGLRTVAGIIKVVDATIMSEDIVDATVELNDCSIPDAVPVLVL